MALERRFGFHRRQVPNAQRVVVVSRIAPGILHSPTNTSRQIEIPDVSSEHANDLFAQPPGFGNEH